MSSAAVKVHSGRERDSGFGEQPQTQGFAVITDAGYVRIKVEGAFGRKKSIDACFRETANQQVAVAPIESNLCIQFRLRIERR
jgi:hypothetical protein